MYDCRDLISLLTPLYFWSNSSIYLDELLLKTISVPLSIMRYFIPLEGEPFSSSVLSFYYDPYICCYCLLLIKVLSSWKFSSTRLKLFLMLLGLIVLEYSTSNFSKLLSSPRSFSWLLKAASYYNGDATWLPRRCYLIADANPFWEREFFTTVYFDPEYVF